MRVLYTTPILEHPAAGGPQLRIENSIKALSRICDLDIFHRAPYPSDAIQKTDSYFLQYARVYQTLYDYPSSRTLRLFLRAFRRLFGQDESKCLKTFVRHIKKEKIDVVWFGYGNISYPLIKALKLALPEIKVVCDTDSVWSRFVLRELPFVEGKRRQEIIARGRASCC